MFARWIRLSLLPLALGVAVACGDDEDDDNGTGPGDELTLEQFVGTWDVVQFQCTNPADPSQTVDYIRDFGVTIGLAIEDDGQFEYTITGPGGSATATGTLTVQDGQVLVANTGEPAEQVTADFSEDGNTLTITAEDTDCDYTGDLEEETDGRLVQVLERG
ncbi:MAG TPA: hypothetical protein VNK43_02045 [Gemmatimonadales bacterium]|nr:hypothetical protein [Gemmatimonadales bacterium]